MSEPMTSVPVPVPAAMPSEDIERILRRHLDADEAIADILRDIVNDVQALFAPILAEKEREKEAAIQVAEMNATAGAFWAERGRTAEARALAAEAALAGERERIEVAEGERDGFMVVVISRGHEIDDLKSELKSQRAHFEAVVRAYEAQGLEDERSRLEAAAPLSARETMRYLEVEEKLAALNSAAIRAQGE